MRARDVLFSGFFVCYVGMCGCGISWHALNAKASKVVVLKYVICLQGTPYSESLKFPGTKWGVRLR